MVAISSAAMRPMMRPDELPGGRLLEGALQPEVRLDA